MSTRPSVWQLAPSDLLADHQAIAALRCGCPLRPAGRVRQVFSRLRRGRRGHAPRGRIQPLPAADICAACAWREIIPAGVFRKRSFWIILRHMIGLTDTQLKIIMQAARVLPVEKRDTFLQRIAAMLALRGRGRFTDTDVADVAQLAMAGLIQSADSAA